MRVFQCIISTVMIESSVMRCLIATSMMTSGDEETFLFTVESNKESSNKDQ